MSLLYILQQLASKWRNWRFRVKENRKQVISLTQQRLKDLHKKR